MYDVMAEFLEVYGQVFDVDGKVCVVGRDKTKRLICLAELVGKDVGNVRDYGSVATGFMNVQNIHALRNSLL